VDEINNLLSEFRIHPQFLVQVYDVIRQCFECFHSTFLKFARFCAKNFKDSITNFKLKCMYGE